MLKLFFEKTTSKKQELKKLYLLIHKYGPINKNELIEMTNIKKTTLVRMIDELLRNNLIKESGFEETSIGRPPILYDVEQESNFIIGIHISRMKTNVVLVDLRYNQIDQESFAMTSIHTPEFVIRKVENIIQRFMEMFDIDEEKLLGIGIVTTGPLNRDDGIILKPESLLEANWGNVNIVKMIQEKFPVRVILEKSSNAAATAEYHAANSVHKNILYCISGGWGMDCGIIMNGEILQENYVSTNGYGHMIIDVDGNLCSCGKRGCIVAYTSFKGILNELNKVKGLVGNMNDELFQKASLNDMMEYFLQGDKITEDVIIRSSQYLGIGLSNLINLFNPDLVILNGPFIYDYKDYFIKVIEYTKKNIQKEKEVKFTQGKLKENAAAVGSAILIFDSYFRD